MSEILRVARQSRHPRTTVVQVVQHGGKLFYTLKVNEGVRFFFLDTTYPTGRYDWIENELKGSNDNWKIVVFHHPLYSSGGRHGRIRRCATSWSRCSFNTM